MVSPAGTQHEAVKSKVKEQASEGWPWIWFAYTGFLFLAPLFQPSVKLWAGTLAVFFLFLLVFRTYVRCQDGDRGRLWMIAATVALGLASFPWNDGASSLFVFAASFLAFSVPNIRRALFWFGVVGALVVAEGALFRHASNPFRISWTQVFIALFLMAIIGGSNILFAEHHRGEQKLKAAQEENVALAALAERERIARDLHDVLGHTLSVIALKAELAGRLIERDPARATSEINDIERMTRTALGEVREAIVGYRAQGLAAEIEAARRTLDAAGVTLLLDSDAGTTAGTLSANEETVLSLALREAITNIVRHAGATTCRLQFVAPPYGTHTRRLVIEDDGEHAELREGNGLRGMRERVESLGGTLALERGVRAQRGTRLCIQLPQLPELPEGRAADAGSHGDRNVPETHVRSGPGAPRSVAA